MAAIKWLPEVLADLERLFAFLNEQNPEAAARAARTILDGAELLLATPQLGRLMSDGTGRRELFLPFAAAGYVLRYLLEDEQTAIIIRVWHSRERRQ